MLRNGLAFTTPSVAPRWRRWLVFSPVARIVIFILLLVAISITMGTLAQALGWAPKNVSELARAAAQLLIRAVPALIAYLLLVKLLERRPLKELAPRRLPTDSAIGVLAGLLLFSTIVGVLAVLGVYHVVGTNPNASWLPSLLLVGLGAGISEEIMFRGVLFRIVEEGMGTWAGLLISALFFGFMHMHNPGATVWSSAAIAMEAGLLFGMIYHVTRSLPICMGLHAAWNFAQGTIYGIPVSGTKADGWLVSTRTGPDWLSGGAFGAEASVVALGVCLLGTLALVALALRRRSLVPFRRVGWHKRITAATVQPLRHGGAVTPTLSRSHGKLPAQRHREC